MSRPLSDIVIALILIVFTIIWIVIVRAAERSALKQLGGEIEVVRLYTKWGRVAQYFLFGLAALLPVVAAIIYLVGERELTETLADIIRSAWFGTVGYGFGRTSRIAIGSRGYLYGPKGFTPWETVEKVEWDRDIGQQSYGVSIFVRERKGTRKQRIYVRRELKQQVETLLAQRIQN